MISNGAIVVNGICRFSVWAPLLQSMHLHIVHPHKAVYTMVKNGDGYFRLELPGAAGMQYYYAPGGGRCFPDPASFAQPDGVHGPSMVVDHSAYQWQDHNWQGIRLEEMIFYEIHTGAFTREGTFDAIIDRLPALKTLGITTIELMPVAAFPGDRNWGYDGVFPFAVHSAYGGAAGLKRLVDACHAAGLAVFLDVVYNHLGPEGNYFAPFGPYFNDTYRTPWGAAINYDGAYSDGVRAFFIENMVYWLEHFHLDGLRFDAVHTIFDHRADPVWCSIRQSIDRFRLRAGRPVYLIAESDLNSPVVLLDPAVQGYGFDAQWLDDFHHALYAVLCPDPGHILYEDFGTCAQIAKALNEGFVHTGQYVRARKRKHGRSSATLNGDRFVAFIQDHDLVGNMDQGKRWSAQAGVRRQQLAAALLLLSPYLPLLFMGEEYGETAPFLYFTHHSDEKLIAAVREGRNRDFQKYFRNHIQPDPQDEFTFQRSKLTWTEGCTSEQLELLEWYKALIALRKQRPALQCFDRATTHAEAVEERGIALKRESGDLKDQLLALFNFSDQPLSFLLPEAGSQWVAVLNSNAGLPADRPKEGRVVLPGASVVLLQPAPKAASI